MKNVHVEEDRFAFEFDGFKVEENLKSLYSDINRHCCDLKSFSMLSNRASLGSLDIFEKNRASLQELDISAFSLTSLPETLLPELKVLRLEFFHVNDADELVTFFARSGGKLVDITINWSWTGSSEWSALIDALRTSCRNVQKISLRTGRDHWSMNGNIPEAEEARLYISYGTQLREAEQLNLDLELC